MHIRPAIEAAETAPARASESPSEECSVGIRNAGPCTIVAELAWAVVPTPSIAQRRATDTSAYAGGSVSTATHRGFHLFAKNDPAAPQL
ncbi:hypothetical protein GCM10027076_18080 [Nocardioides montaniterrae]